MTTTKATTASTTAGRERVVVLGGTGFLGREMCAAFDACGYEVVAVARRAVSLPSAKMVTLDLARTPIPTLTEFFADQSPIAVVNVAGALWRPVTSAQMTESNVDLVRRMLAALTALPVPPRFVQVGTVHEYGTIPAGVELTERTPCAPESTYGRTKLLAADAVLASADRLPACVLRLSNVIGPRIPIDSLAGKVTAALADAHRLDQPAVIELYSLDAQRDFIDVRDTASAIIAAARSDATGVINIGSGVCTGVRELVTTLIEISGVPTTLIERTPKPSDLASGRASSGRMRVESSVAETLLGWAPRHDVPSSLRRLWRHAIGHHDLASADVNASA